MAVTRKFLDWGKPALPAVVEDLKSRYTVLGSCDLSNALIVFPGQQAKHRFLELLTSMTGGQLSPPKIITVGQLPEELYEPKLSFASQLTQRLAWAEALKNLPSDHLKTIIAQPPGERDVDAWMNLGELLSKQHRELAADLLSFADVSKKGSTLAEFNESNRWNVLAQVQENYLGLLDSYELWDQQTARLVAIEQQECRTSQDIILVGTVDLNRTMRAMLDQVSDRVTAYVHGPANLSTKKRNQLFDHYGCLQSEAWAEYEIEIDDQQISVVDGPAEQAEAVVQQLARYQGRYAQDDITVSVPDDRVVPHIRRTLHQFQVPTRWVIASKLIETSPYRLLDAVAHYLESNSTKDFLSTDSVSRYVELD